MNEAQVCLIKSGSSIAKIHSHMARKSVKCVLSMSGPLECRGCCCTFKGQLISGYFIGAICSPRKCCQIRDDVCSHQLGYNNVSTAKTIKSPLLTSSLNLQSAPAESVTENTRTCFALSVFPSGRGNFDSTSGTCSDRSQMIFRWGAAELLESSEWPRELWERSSSSHSSPSATLEEPLQRAGWSPVEVLRLAHPSPSVSPLRPHLKLSGQPLVARCQSHCWDRSLE